MLIAKLKNTIDFEINSTPTKKETRICNAFFATPLNYVLGEKKASFNVTFGEIKEVSKNPSSDIQGEGETTYDIDRKKIFNITIDGEDLDKWGANDESLLQIIAEKYEIEIEEFKNFII